MKSLYQRAEEKAQDYYRQTLRYASEKVGVAFRNMFNKEKEPEPKYADSMPKENYLLEIIAIMNDIHDSEIKSLIGDQEGD